MKTALVTGGQRGIGRAVVGALAADGFEVVVSAEVPAEHPDVMETLAATGARYVRHDMADVDGVARALDAIGPVDCFVANAGVAPRVRADMLDITPDNYDFVQGINTRGTFFLAQGVAKRMLVTPSDAYRSLVFVTSSSADHVSLTRAEYCLSKAAGAMMAKLFAVRLAEAGIGVFELRPGIIRTPMTAGVTEKYDALIADGLVPAGRWGEPGDIASTVVPLANGAFQFATGTVVPIDGGLSIARF